MVFESNGKPSLTIDTICLIVTSTNFLEIIIDDNMSWKEHIMTQINNLTSQKYMLQLVKKFIPMKSKRLLYCTHVLSRINYGHIIWGPMINQASKTKSIKYKNIAFV